MLIREVKKTIQERAERYDYPSTIEYELDPPEYGTVHKAVTVNISKTGLAAYLFTNHREGQNITIITPLPVDRARATVRWSKMESESFFLAGLKFTDCTSSS